MTQDERRHGMEELQTDVAVVKERQLEFEKRFDRHEAGEFQRYDETKDAINNNTKAISRLETKLSGMNGWMLGFGAACAAFGGFLALAAKKLFGW